MKQYYKILLIEGQLEYKALFFFLLWVEKNCMFFVNFSAWLQLMGRLLLYRPSCVMLVTCRVLSSRFFIAHSVDLFIPVLCLGPSNWHCVNLIFLLYNKKLKMQGENMVSVEKIIIIIIIRQLLFRIVNETSFCFSHHSVLLKYSYYIT